MTVQECYTQLHGDYNDIRKRLPSDKIIARIMLMYLDDPNIDNLHKHLAAEDYEDAFEDIHTLKGALPNIAFTELYQSVCELTEVLRAEKKAPDPAVLKKVDDAQELVVSTLRKFKSEQQ